MNEVLETAIKAVEIYASKYPRPHHVNQQQAADMLGKSHVTVRKMIRSGELRINSAGMIPISEIDRFIAPRAA